MRMGLWRVRYSPWALREMGPVMPMEAASLFPIERRFAEAWISIW